MQPLKYKHIPNYTIDDYKCWEGEWELIDGIPYAMSPSPNRTHQLLVTRLVVQIDGTIFGPNGGGCEVVAGLDWIVNETTVLRPDVAVICNETGNFISNPPVLLVEILSPPTAFKDRQMKFDIYQEHGVKYYLIVDPDKKTYATYQLIEGEYREQNNLNTFALHNNCSAELNIVKALAELGI